jgi:hypothetical protein
VSLSCVLPGWVLHSTLSWTAEQDIAAMAPESSHEGSKNSLYVKACLRR